MVNLSECKFGDLLKTRDGRMAMYIGKGEASSLHIISVKGELEISHRAINHYDDNGELAYCNQREFDIVGKWEDEK